MAKTSVIGSLLKSAGTAALQSVSKNNPVVNQMAGMVMRDTSAQNANAAIAGGAAGAAVWTCSCGKTGNTGKFCVECGKPAPTPVPAWVCSCGKAGNTGKFCAECGKPAPAAAWACSCGHAGNTGKFCAECGKPQQ